MRSEIFISGISFSCDFLFYEIFSIIFLLVKLFKDKIKDQGQKAPYFGALVRMWQHDVCIPNI